MTADMSAVQQKAAAVGGAAPAASLPWLRADAGPGLITVGGFAAQAEDLPGAWSRPRGPGWTQPAGDPGGPSALAE